MPLNTEAREICFVETACSAGTDEVNSFWQFLRLFWHFQNDILRPWKQDGKPRIGSIKLMVFLLFTTSYSQLAPFNIGGSMKRKNKHNLY